MHSIAPAASGTPEELWALFQAQRELGDAAEALGSAAAALSGLGADTAWQSDGVRALSTLLGELRAGAMREEATVRFDASRIGSMA